MLCARPLQSVKQNLIPFCVLYNTWILQLSHWCEFWVISRSGNYGVNALFSIYCKLLHLLTGSRVDVFVIAWKWWYPRGEVYGCHGRSRELFVFCDKEGVSAWRFRSLQGFDCFVYLCILCHFTLILLVYVTILCTLPSMLSGRLLEPPAKLIINPLAARHKC